MKVEVLKDVEYPLLASFLNKIPQSLVYYSPVYKNFLENFLKEKATYFIIKEGEAIIALLPAVLKTNETYGNVLNSLPFYGSNGSILSLEFDPQINTVLINAFHEFAVLHKCVSSTLITSPFESNIKWFDENLDFTFKDQRIGQITKMSDTKEGLMDIYHSKTRNTVRKSLSGLKRIEYGNGLDYLDFIVETHKENLTAVNGLYKPKSCFEEIAKNFPYKDHLKIYIGFNEQDKPIAGLLNLYYNKTVEYFCPVTVSAYRDMQPLSGIIYQAMQDAVDEGYQWWNWGGTWLSQGGVYQFKSRWGTADHDYFYYTKLYDNSVLELSPEILLREYPYFYVLPFSALTKKEND